MAATPALKTSLRQLTQTVAAKSVYTVMLQFLNNQILQLQMTDNQMPSQQSKAAFSLIRLKPECKMLPIRVDFEAPLRPNKAAMSIIPTFHPDGRYFTPAFLLPADKKYFQQNTAFEKCQFEEKLQRSLQDTSCEDCLPSHQDLYQAAPNSNFCQVCQEKFDNYFQHISLKQHRTRAQNSPTSLKITQLCTLFQQHAEQDHPSHKTKGIRKDSKRQEKALPIKKLHRTPNPQPKETESLLKGHNFSTCLLEDSLLEFNE